MKGKSEQRERVLKCTIYGPYRKCINRLICGLIVLCHFRDAEFAAKQAMHRFHGRRLGVASFNDSNTQQA